MVFLAVCIGVSSWCHFMALLICGMSDGYCGHGFAWFNPCFIYRHTKTNWFGTIVLTIVINAMMLVIAICYWFYKLCTVGRR